MANRLKRDFYHGDTYKKARKLLGKRLVKAQNDKIISGEIVEAEAYFGQEDPPSHASAGRTRRSETMWKNPGLVYVYLVYGVHYMFNIVTEEKGKPGAVLIRAVEPLTGLQLMQNNRESRSKKNLTNGPGKLTQSFDITLAENELDLVTSDRLWIESGEAVAQEKIERTTRIGVSTGKEKKLRFYLKGNEFVSPG